MKWSDHPTNRRYIRCTELPITMLVRVARMDKGYLWQAGKFYGYADTTLNAMTEAEEVALIQILDDEAIS